MTGLSHVGVVLLIVLLRKDESSLLEGNKAPDFNGVISSNRKMKILIINYLQSGYSNRNGASNKSIPNIVSQ